jgi:superoxide dismutase, Cu-Zn family
LTATSWTDYLLGLEPNEEDAVRFVVLFFAGAMQLLVLGAAAADSEPGYASFTDREGRPVGHALLAQGPRGVLIRLELDRLPPGWKAIHIHRHGECRDHEQGFQASGGHLDPHGRAHGLLNEDGPELGDLPNVYAHSDGTVRAELHATGVRLDASEKGLLRAGGTAFVIHEGPDDHRTQPIGGAGARVACAAIRGPE